MNDKIKCEQCLTAIIGEYDRSDKNNTKSVFYDNARICGVCKAEFCNKCHLIMVKKQRCFSCGSEITNKKSGN